MYEYIYSALVYLLLFLIAAIGIKKKPIDDKRELLQRFNDVRGLFAIEIVVGHVIRFERTLMYPLGKFMIISVAFFFFCSAFGMVQSFYGKEHYLKGFLIRKCGYLFILAVIINLVNVLISIISGTDTGYYAGAGEIVNRFFSQTNWYIWELIAFYAIFYMVYRFFKKYRCIIVFAIALIATTILFKNGWNEGWYASALAFPMGMLVGEYYDKLRAFLFSAKGVFATVLMAFAGLSCLFLGGDSLIGMVYLRNILCIAALLIMTYFFSNFQLANRVLGMSGRYSTEIYLSQFVWLRVSEVYGWNYMVRLPFVLVATGITAYVIHFVFWAIKKKINKF